MAYAPHVHAPPLKFCSIERRLTSFVFATIVFRTFQRTHCNRLFTCFVDSFYFSQKQFKKSFSIDDSILIQSANTFKNRLKNSENNQERISESKSDLSLTRTLNLDLMLCWGTHLIGCLPIAEIASKSPCA